MAQTEKGSKFIGVSIGNIGYQKDNYFSSIGADLNPSAGVFVTDNLLLGSGLQVGYRRTKSNGNSSNYTNRTISYGISPFARYYFSGAATHRFFGQVSGGVARYNQRRESDDYVSPGGVSRDNSTYFTYGGALGYNYFLTPGAALEVTAGYNRFGFDERSTNGSFNIQAGVAVFLPSKL
jgi:outer membrane protein